MRPTIVVWLWGDKYSDRHVHMLQAQLQISYPKPHRLKQNKTEPIGQTFLRSGQI